jgi:CRISPR/Cas system endoribonuclease Cas6 (RAMP superfamily)
MGHCRLNNILTKKEEKYKFVTILSPVNLTRIIKSAKNACAWANSDDDNNYLTNVNNIIKKYDGVVNELTFDNIIQEIFVHCKNNSDDFKTNFFDS